MNAAPTITPTAPPTAAPTFVVTVVTEEPTPAVTPSPTPLPYPWIDAISVMSGLCYDSVRDAAGQVFIIHNIDELNRFFDLADNSRLCRHPVGRSTFSFDGDRVLAGTWSIGSGCTAHHEVIEYRRDDTAKTFFVFVRFVTEGDCGYDLVRPYWIGIEGMVGYEVQIIVS